jgi:ketosteroid isomerase-like protein
MWHRNEQLLRTNYEAFGNGDVAPLLASLADDIQWHVSGPSSLAGDLRCGGDPRLLWQHA